MLNYFYFAKISGHTVLKTTSNCIKNEHVRIFFTHKRLESKYCSFGMFFVLLFRMPYQG